MNRIERISAILIQLQSKKIVKAQEIADRFDISLRTVYRDIHSLEESGVPIIGEAGIGYSLMDGYRLPPIMFTKEEAMALITAEKLVEKFADNSIKTTYESALYKIKSVLKPIEKDNLNNLTNHIQIVQNQYDLRQDSNSAIQNILKSIEGKTQIKINYFSNHSQENNERVVEPVGIFHSGNSWYLIAYCLLRKDYRHFKINRISSSTPLDQLFEKEHPSLNSFLEKTTKERDLLTIRIIIEKSIIRYLGEEMYYQGFISKKKLSEEKFEFTFLSASLMGFSIWYLQIAEFAEIIEPASLKLIVKEKIELLSKKY